MPKLMGMPVLGGLPFRKLFLRHSFGAKGPLDGLANGMAVTGHFITVAGLNAGIGLDVGAGGIADTSWGFTMQVPVLLPFRAGLGR